MFELMRLSGQEYVDEYAAVVKLRLAGAETTGADLKGAGGSQATGTDAGVADATDTDGEDAGTDGNDAAAG
jgi:1-acyl-sn-glycerol-3-phosphate acyltransferase